jgi:succinyl-diaminopimelate desuccinylase
MGQTVSPGPTGSTSGHFGTGWEFRSLAQVIDLLDLAAELVDIPSESHHETAIADHFESRLATASHLRVERVGDNVVARTELGHAHRLVIAGHLDTVPANENLGARIEGDRLYGLGACDMKGGLAAQLATAIEVADPAVDVTYVFYAGEEVAARYNGLLHLFRDRPDLVEGDVALLGEPTSAVIEAGCQGTLRARVTYRGKRAHTARPWMGRNAIHRLGAVLSRLSGYEGRRPVIDGCEYHEAIQAVFVEGGVAGNVVPDEAVLTVNLRYAPDRTPAEAEAHLAEQIGDNDGFEITDHSIAAAPTLTHPLLAALINRNQLAVKAKLGWTDVARFAEHGVPAANFGAGDASISHTRDEFVERHEIETVHAALADLLRHGA